MSFSIENRERLVLYDQVQRLYKKRFGQCHLTRYSLDLSVNTLDHSPCKPNQSWYVPYRHRDHATATHAHAKHKSYPAIILNLLFLQSDSTNNPTESLPPLDDPSKWATGGDAATDRQKDFVAQLAASTSAHDVNIDELSKGDASAKIEELKARRDDGAQANVCRPFRVVDSWLNERRWSTDRHLIAMGCV